LYEDWLKIGNFLWCADGGGGWTAIIRHKEGQKNERQKKKAVAASSPRPPLFACSLTRVAVSLKANGEIVWIGLSLVDPLERH
jgi:hypothetical protein